MSNPSYCTNVYDKYIRFSPVQWWPNPERDSGTFGEINLRPFRSHFDSAAFIAFCVCHIIYRRCRQIKIYIIFGWRMDSYGAVFMPELILAPFYLSKPSANEGLFRAPNTEHSIILSKFSEYCWLIGV